MSAPDLLAGCGAVVVGGVAGAAGDEDVAADLSFAAPLYAHRASHLARGVTGQIFIAAGRCLSRCSTVTNPSGIGWAPTCLRWRTCSTSWCWAAPPSAD
ncbi:MAG: hypothetical protein K2X97_06320 [Mycobacteriaceae bacterium]|nr:hypothetical protein [Mycobacteriaceae bacterium]